MIRTHMTDSILIRRDRVYPESKYSMKPNGLWYAAGLAWLDWCRSEQPDWVKSRLFRLEIDTTDVLRLETKEQVQAFNEKYNTSHFGMNQIDWQSVKQDYKGIEAIPYHWQLRYGAHSHLWYYGLDVPSGCLWDLSVLKKTSMIQPYEQAQLEMYERSIGREESYV